MLPFKCNPFGRHFNLFGDCALLQLLITSWQNFWIDIFISLQVFLLRVIVLMSEVCQ